MLRDRNGFEQAQSVMIVVLESSVFALDPYGESMLTIVGIRFGWRLGLEKSWLCLTRELRRFMIEPLSPLKKDCWSCLREAQSMILLEQ